MAQTERQTEERRANKREKAKANRGRRGAAQGHYKVGREAMWQLMVLSLAFMEAEGALRIGLTRDGGALALGCYLGDDYATEYVRPSEDLAAALNEIAEAWLPDGTAALEHADQDLRA